MKLSVNLIAGGRYYKAGEEVPGDQVSPFAAELAAQERQDAATNAAPEAPAVSPLPADSEAAQTAGTHVKRGSSWKPIERESPLPGEQLYQRKGKAFVPAGGNEP